MRAAVPLSGGCGVGLRARLPWRHNPVQKYTKRGGPLFPPLLFNVYKAPQAKRRCQARNVATPSGPNLARLRSTCSGVRSRSGWLFEKNLSA